MVFSSGISGRDPADGSLPDDPAKQARFAFENLVTLLADAGGSVGDIGHMKVYLKDRSAYREHVDEQWLAMFPDPDDRPARHAIEADLPGGLLLQLEVIAVLRDEA